MKLAEILRVDKQRIYSLVREGAIPVIRLGERQYRFSAQAIEQFLQGGGTQKEVGENGKIKSPHFWRNDRLR